LLNTEAAIWRANNIQCSEKKRGVGVVNLTVNWLKESGEKIGFGGAILG
jgi:hypothetical protein